MTTLNRERKTPSILKSFTQHPATVGETYGQHLLFAAKFSLNLLGASAAAMVHAFVPALFEDTASRKIHVMHDEMARRHTKSSQ